MKKRNLFLVTFVIIALLILSTVLMVACDKQEQQSDSQQSDTEQKDAPKDNTPSSDWYKTSEEAMDNFVMNLSECNYVVVSKINDEEILTTTVANENEVTFVLNPEKYDSGSFAVFGIWDEVFQASLKSDGLKNIMFLNSGFAVEIAKPQLPHAWLDNGNIWDYFTNDDSLNPLHFVSNSQEMQTSIAYFANIGEMYVSTIQEIELEFEKKSAKIAHIKAKYSPAVIALVDIDITITIGEGKSDARVEQWLEDENRELPEAMSEWDGIYELAIASVMMDSDINKCVPFFDNLSYATTINGNTFIEGVVYIHDYRATPQDMVNYAFKLIDSGFERVADGDLYSYRKELREREGTGEKCYASILLDFYDGVEIVVMKCYDYKEYYDLEDINALITQKGYAGLTSDDNFANYYAFDYAYEATEGLNYLFDYDLMLSVTIEYEDENQVQQYINDYIESLTGFTYNETEDYWYQQDELGYRSFRYKIDEFGLEMLFKSEAYQDITVASTYLSDKFIIPDSSSLSTAQRIIVKDLTMYEKVQFGHDDEKVYRYSIEFADESTPIDFLDAYMELLIADSDYELLETDGNEKFFVNTTNNGKIILQLASSKMATILFEYPKQ